LALAQRLASFGAIAERVGLGIAEETADHGVAANADYVDRIVGKIAQEEARRVDFLALVCPFRGHGFGERAARHDLRAAADGLEAAPVEQHAPAALGFFGGDGLVKALHGRGDLQRRASTVGMTSASTSPTTRRT